jgi:hypothetical protein
VSKYFVKVQKTHIKVKQHKNDTTYIYIIMTTVDIVEENNSFLPVQQEQPQQQQPPQPPVEQEIRLTDVTITDQVVALNILVAFMNVAQRRGAFSMDESAKIWECVKHFTPPDAVPVPPAPAATELEQPTQNILRF